MEILVQQRWYHRKLSHFLVGDWSEVAGTEQDQVVDLERVWLD